MGVGTDCRSVGSRNEGGLGQSYDLRAARRMSARTRRRAAAAFNRLAVLGLT